MITRLNKLYSLTNEFPNEAQAVERLAKFVDSRSGKTTEVSINRLFDVAGPTSASSLAKIIKRSVELGVFNEIIRVEIDGVDTNRDFPKIEDVPKVVHNSIKDIDIEVRPKDLQLYYKLKL